MTEPQITEITVHVNGNGRVALEGYGGESSGYGVARTRKFSIPEDWTVEQVEAFEREQTEKLATEIEPYLTEERQARFDARNWDTFK